MKTSRLTLGMLAVTLLVGAGLAFAAPPTKSVSAKKKETPLFRDVHAQTKQFIAWSDSITLTPE